MQLDVESLRTFAAVVDTGGMTRAAEQLGLSQSAVSWKIKRLEDKIGRNLLVRQGRSIRASREGEELLRYARTIVDTHDEAVALLSGSELTGRIRLGTTEEVTAHVLGPVIGRFNRVHPGITIEIQIDNTSDLETRLAAGALDLVLIQTSPQDQRTTDTMLWVDEQRWISSPEWTYDEGPVPLVTFGIDGFYRAKAQEALRRAGIRSTVVFSGPSTASVIAAIEAGLGVAAISGRSVSGEVIDWPRGHGLVELPPINQVARLAPGETSPEVAELLADLQRVLGDPGSVGHRPVG